MFTPTPILTQMDSLSFFLGVHFFDIVLDLSAAQEKNLETKQFIDKILKKELFWI